MPKSPLLPKTPQFQVTSKPKGTKKGGPIPNLLSINPSQRVITNTPSQIASNTPPQNQVDQDPLAAQIKINADVMDELQKLRKDREELMMIFEQAMKEKEYFRSQLEKSNEQMQLLKKKLDKRPNDGKKVQLASKSNNASNGGLNANESSNNVPNDNKGPNNAVNNDLKNGLSANASSKTDSSNDVATGNSSQN